MAVEADPAQLFLIGVAYKPNSIAQALYQLINCSQPPNIIASVANMIGNL